MQFMKDKSPELTHQIRAQTAFNTGDKIAKKNNVTNFTQEQTNSTEINICSSTMESNFRDDDVNVTEILISTKQTLEQQVRELQSKLSQLENSYTIVVYNNRYCKLQIVNLEHEIKSIQERLVKSTKDNMNKEKIIAELNYANSAYTDENNNLREQLEFTQSALRVKETENNILQRQVVNLQIDIDSTHLQLQQISSGLAQSPATEQQLTDPDKNPDVLLQNICNLEKQLKASRNENKRLKSHYEHYLYELNDQLKLTAKRNHELEEEVQRLSTRERSLIDQINNFEILIQTMSLKSIEISPVQAAFPRSELMKDDTELNDLRDRCNDLQNQLTILCKKYEEMQNNFAESEAKVQKQGQTTEKYCQHDSISSESLSKLTAEMASDKISAQRATKQNKKLKKDLQELEEAFVKISRDKLELMEKVTAEKYLNREFTKKLAEVQEVASDVYNKLHSKDLEMIGLQNSYKELEKEISEKKVQTHKTNAAFYSDSAEHGNCDNDEIGEQTHHQCLLNKKDCDNCGLNIPKKDAMIKLQDRFLKIMDEVANLSDEKHRLEHIILQLQFETDTICEYVALYQQQRSELKKRDEERNAQIKIFQSECGQLKRQLEELNGIIIRLAQDKELVAFFQLEHRKSDIVKVMHLLSYMRSNTLIDPSKSSSELKNFYPCNCCSGKLIEI